MSSESLADRLGRDRKLAADWLRQRLSDALGSESVRRVEMGTATHHEQMAFLLVANLIESRATCDDLIRAGRLIESVSVVVAAKGGGE